MTPGDFIPFGGDLGEQSTASFVRTGSGTPGDEAPPEIAPITPAEANDLPGQIHQILQDHLSGESLENAAVAIQSAVEAAPARVALPEIKLSPAPAPEGEAGNEGEAASTAPPVLEYEREGDVVRRVIVNCSCGQSIHLDCDY
jgi:hypothetical protein